MVFCNNSTVTIRNNLIFSCVFFSGGGRYFDVLLVYNADKHHIYYKTIFYYKNIDDYFVAGFADFT